MKGFYDNAVKSGFEMILKDSYINNKGEDKFVAYSELLITIPNEKTNLLVIEALESYIKEDGLQIFNSNLKKIIRNGILGINGEREFTVEEKELYSNICDFYNGLVDRLEIT